MARTEVVTSKQKALKTKDGFIVMGGFDRNPMIDLRELADKKPLLAYYIGSKTIESAKFETGSGVLHDLQIKETGELVSAWGVAVINKRLAEVLEQYGVGVLVRITYQGLNSFKDKQGKKRKAHGFLVEVNPADKLS